MKVLIIGLLIFLLYASGASATMSTTDEEFELISAEDLGYTIIPAKSSDNEVAVRTVYDTITQGEVNWHGKTVSTYIESLNVDLNWGDSSNSLRLTIYDPNNHCIGTFYDSDDGKTDDGRINLYVRNSSGIEQGTWRYMVYGYSVSGTEDYSI